MLTHFIFFEQCAHFKALYFRNERAGSPINQCIQYNTIQYYYTIQYYFISKLPGRNLNTVVTVTGNQYLSLNSCLTIKLQSNMQCDLRLSVRSWRQVAGSK